FRLGRCREQLGESSAAIRAYVEAAACPDRDQPYRLSAVARLAALYEARHEYTRALAAYRDLIQNSKDRELIASAPDRVSQPPASQRLHLPPPNSKGETRCSATSTGSAPCARARS